MSINWFFFLHLLFLELDNVARAMGQQLMIDSHVDQLVFFLHLLFLELDNVARANEQ